MVRYNAEDILIARERKTDIQKMLIDRYGLPLMTVKVNYPGLYKNNELTGNIMEAMTSLIKDILTYKVTCSTLTYGAEGPILFLVVDEDPIKLKKLAVEIEERHILGRCIDLDVYEKDGSAIGRQQLGLPMRQCFICSDTAHSCVRSRKHSQDELISYIKARYREFKESLYAK